MELKRDVIGISPRMLSKELQEPEVHGIITRQQHATKPITVCYELSEYGKNPCSCNPYNGHMGEGTPKKIIGALN